MAALVLTHQLTRDLTVWSRFGEPGLFMLHHNLPFLKLKEHHQNSAVYEPVEDSPRPVVLTLINILLEQSRLVTNLNIIHLLPYLFTIHVSLRSLNILYFCSISFKGLACS